jgi:hypothetical protein
MPFISNLEKYKSLSIVGLDKNTGKTVCLNYILSRLSALQRKVAVTSIGIDGEKTDQVFGSHKPEITLYEGMQFITSEKHYAARELLSKVVHVDTDRTALGRLIAAEVLCSGKVLLSGASTTEKLRSQINYFSSQDIDITIIDGALSRLSLASPSITDAMVLCTGAAVSPNLRQLIAKTRFTFDLINIQEIQDSGLRTELSSCSNGLWAVDNEGQVHDLNIPSVFLLAKSNEDIFRYGDTIYASGAVSDNLLKCLSTKKNIKNQTLIVRDFTKLFVTAEHYAAYMKKGGRIMVLQQSKLIAVCLNPTSPQGYTIDSAEACSRLAENLKIPVWDVCKIDK